MSKPEQSSETKTSLASSKRSPSKRRDPSPRSRPLTPSELKQLKKDTKKADRYFKERLGLK